jgi:hypothetical protein
MTGKYASIFVPLTIILLLLTTGCAVEGVTALSLGEHADNLTEAGVEYKETDRTGSSAEDNQGYLTGAISPTLTTTETVSISNPEVQQRPVTSSVSSGSDASTTGPGQVPGGAGVNTETTEGDEIVGDEPEEIDSTAWQVYTDDVFHFSISYPSYYSIKHLEDAQLTELSPSPLAAIHFSSEHGELADIAPPEFSIRVFDNRTEQSVEDWLITTGLLKPEAAWFTEPYQGVYESGVKVISARFMAPGWFVYVADNTHIFQLTPLGTEAELMLDTFAIQR